MKTKPTKLTTAIVNNTSITRYGVTVAFLPDTGCLWLAEHLLEEYGIAAYKLILKIRRTIGKDMTYPVYGSDLWNALEADRKEKVAKKALKAGK